MTTTQGHSQRRTKPARRTALALLAAIGIAVAAGTVAAPLAGTAHAGSASGAGPIWGR